MQSNELINNVLVRRYKILRGETLNDSRDLNHFDRQIYSFGRSLLLLFFSFFNFSIFFNGKIVRSIFTEQN